MKVSLNWIKEFTEVSLSVDELVEKIGAQLGAVEEVVDLSKKYQGIIIAKVVTCEKHPNADKLKVCRIDDNGVVKDLARNAENLIEVVCGAPNVAEGMLVAWLPPGTTVPVTYSKDPLVLEARQIRGVVSNGMLASAHELAISDDHDGILELDLPGLKPGDDFAKAYKLDDQVIDIENKMFTHRPDLFGQLGVAREIAGIQQQTFTSPDWYMQEKALEGSHDEGVRGLSLHDEIPELCPRYMAVIVSGIKVTASPLWLQSVLSRVGIRPINNIVDMTNYMMMLTGQPLHAFDFDKVAVDGKATIVVRKPRKGEKMTLLDGKTIEPHRDAVLICDQDKPIALGGVMGGNNSEIDAGTTRIIIECANFDMYNIRKTAMRHGLFTDAVTRFNKGQSPLQCPAVLYKAVQMTAEVNPGATSIGRPVDANYKNPPHEPLSVSAEFINIRLGLKLPANEMAQLLKNVEFKVEVEGDSLVAIAPFWRTDIEIPEDIVEEVGRLYGYDHLPLELPGRPIIPSRRNGLLDVKTDIRDALSAAGANELLTYSFVHGNLLDKVGQNKDLAFQLSNAQSPDLQYYRLSLTPSLLDKVHPNIKAGHECIALFEIGKAHLKGEMDADEPGIPKEVNGLSFVFAANDKAAKSYAGAPYYQAKKYLYYLFDYFKVKGIKIEPLNGADLYDDSWLEQMVAPFEPVRSAVLRDTKGVLTGTKGLVWGVVGEYKNKVKKTLKLPGFSAGFELDPLLFLGSKTRTEYVPLSRYPRVQQDISLKLPADITYGEVYNEIWQNLEKLKPDNTNATLVPVDIYQDDKDVASKQVSFRLAIASYERTLTAEEVNALLDKVAAAAASQLKAERI